MAYLNNTIDQPAYNGMGVRVYINPTDTNEKATFDDLYIGLSVTAPSAIEGKVYSIDTFGYSFVVVPNMPTESFCGYKKYILNKNDQLSINF